MTAPLGRLELAGTATDGAAFVASLGLRDRRPGLSGPRVVAAMVGSLDGRATVQGSASGLGSTADREVFRELRTASDALLVGAGTLIAERYATVLDAPQQERRRQAGLPREPVVATISRRADPALADVPLFAETGLRIQVYTEAGDPPAFERGADVAVSVVEPGTLSPSACLDHLQRERGADVVMCEGGPTLLHALLADGLVDDLILTLAPMVVAGEGRSILHGPVFDPPARLALQAVLRGEDHLFLHYAVAP